MWLLSVVGVLCLTTLVIVITSAIVTRRKSARERALEQAVRTIRDLANQYRETDAGLSYEILDLTRSLERRELL